MLLRHTFERTVRTHARTLCCCTVIAGFEFAIKKNLKQDRIMVALMLLNKISICFVELEEVEKKHCVIVTILTHLILWLVLNLFHTFPNISFSCCLCLALSLYFFRNATKMEEILMLPYEQGSNALGIAMAWKCSHYVPGILWLFISSSSLENGQSI